MHYPVFMLDPRGPKHSLYRFSGPLALAGWFIPVLVLAVAWYTADTIGLVIAAILLLATEFFAGTVRRTFTPNHSHDKVMAPRVDICFKCHQPDNTLGWSLKPGCTNNSFHIPRKQLSRKYSVTVDALGRRATAGKHMQTGPVIAVFGDSNTFGWGLDDNETWPWLLQEQLQDFTVLNHGVSGYSVYQTLLVMEQVIPALNPEAVIVGFTPDLDTRSVNSFSQARRNSKEHGASPTCLLREDGDNIELWRGPLECYQRLPQSSRFTMVRLVETALNRIRFRGREKFAEATTEQVFIRMKKLCAEHTTPLHIQFLGHRNRHPHWLTEHDFHWSPSPIDLNACNAAGNYRYRLEPFDGHPNAAAHREYAKTVGAALHPLLNNKKEAALPEG